jgi:hypothetical protein
VIDKNLTGIRGQKVRRKEWTILNRVSRDGLSEELTLKQKLGWRKEAGQMKEHSSSRGDRRDEALWLEYMWHIQEKPGCPCG